MVDILILPKGSTCMTMIRLRLLTLKTHIADMCNPSNYANLAVPDSSVFAATGLRPCVSFRLSQLARFDTMCTIVVNAQ